MNIFLVCFLCIVLANFGNAKQNSDQEVIKHVLYSGQKNVALEMLDVIQKESPNQNVLFSPFSTFNALLLAYFCAEGHTKIQLARVLHLSQGKHFFQTYNAYMLYKQARSENPFVGFTSANKIYFDKNIPAKDSFMNYFQDEIEALDFRRDAEVSRTNINKWIANITHNEISQTLSPKEVNTLTQIVLVNAVYLKSKWYEKFNSSQTTWKPFYTAHNQSSQVEMMHKEGHYQYTANRYISARILQIPYNISTDHNQPSDISMIIILPQHEFGLNDVLSELTLDNLMDAVKNSYTQRIELSLPKFNFKQNRDLKPILRKLGITSLFKESANLSNLFAKQINFKDAKHVAKIKVDEDDSIAVTSLIDARVFVPTSISFNCNQPFLYFIYDHTMDTILFTGIYRHPETPDVN